MLRSLLICFVLLSCQIAEAQYAGGAVKIQPNNSATTEVPAGASVSFRYTQGDPTVFPIIWEWFVDGVSIGFDTYEITITSLDPRDIVVTATAYDMMFMICETSGVGADASWVPADRARTLISTGSGAGVMKFQAQNKILEENVSGRYKFSAHLTWDSDEETIVGIPEFGAIIGAEFQIPNITFPAEVVNKLNDTTFNNFTTPLDSLTLYLTFYSYNPITDAWTSRGNQSIRIRVFKIGNGFWKISL